MCRFALAKLIHEKLRDLSNKILKEVLAESECPRSDSNPVVIDEEDARREGSWEGGFWLSPIFANALFGREDWGESGPNLQLK